MDEPPRLDTTGVWLTTSLCRALRAVDRRRLRAHFNDDRALIEWLAALTAPPDERPTSPGVPIADAQLTPAQASALCEPALHRRVQQALDWQRGGTNRHLIGLSHPHYPAALRQISDPPWMLYLTGQPAELSAPHLAIVGSRRASLPARQFAAELAQGLARAGVGVVSGLARGIDGDAHQGCLAAGGITLAVAATAPDRVYPAAHRELARRITINGAVLGELALGTPLKPGCFPRRNRLISGLSLGVVVVEAALPSGSLITARTALDQGREVMAVPGSVLNPQARGCHALIRDGATLVEGVDDVLAVLAPVLALQWPDWSTTSVTAADSTDALATRAVTESSTGLVTSLVTGPATGPEAALLQALGFEPTGLERLVQRLGWPPGRVAGILTQFEINGQVRATGDGRYIRCKSPADGR